MMRYLAIFAMIAATALFAFYGGRAAFTGQSYGARPCKEFTWQKGDKTKGYGQDVVSPCNAGIH